MKEQSHILVIGGTGNIGLEICKKFLLNNYNLTFTSTSKKKILDVKKSLKKINKNSLINGIHCDLLKKNSLKKIISNFFKIKSYNKIVINCCGIFEIDGVNKVNQSNLVKLLKINTFPIIYINQEINKIKKKSQNCRIYTLGSSSSYMGVGKTIGYCLSKHALLGIVRSLNKELNNKNIWNILVSSGTVKNKMGKNIKGIKTSTLINSTDISDTIFNLTKLKSSFADEIWLKRLKP